MLSTENDFLVIMEVRTLLLETSTICDIPSLSKILWFEKRIMYDVEKQSDRTYIGMQSVAVRNQFIRKVFTILVIQLLVTFGLVILAWYVFCMLITRSNVSSFRIWLYSNSFVISMFSLIVMVGLMVISICMPQCTYCLPLSL